MQENAILGGILRASIAFFSFAIRIVGAFALTLSALSILHAQATAPTASEDPASVDQNRAYVIVSPLPRITSLARQRTRLLRVSSVNRFFVQRRKITDCAVFRVRLRVHYN
jgi:hypothetical protein